MPRSPRGFTLIELVIVIILLGILSVTAMSRLIGRSSFDAIVVRDQAIAMARQIQLLGMNNPVNLASPDTCLALVVKPSALGTPASPSCSANATSTRMLTTEADRVSFTFQDGAHPNTRSVDLYFDMLGRPTTVKNRQQQRVCTETRCEITITARNGEQASLCINSEGYINDCTL
ncbi:type II secretion system protein [Photobacterium nomapromontoriensis]|uniref:type II secretion system protein n=1 Tax=Photobacterium nomapromontoriensis TaxID=2910237 RepID=UPI003D10993B